MKNTTLLNVKIVKFLKQVSKLSTLEIANRINRPIGTVKRWLSVEIAEQFNTEEIQEICDPIINGEITQIFKEIRTRYVKCCNNCSLDFETTNNYSKFCSNECFQESVSTAKYNEWICGGNASSNPVAKKLVIKRDGYKCNKCGIFEWCNNPIGLELEHINGNGDDNVSSNLILLCPNCHSQTPTFKAKNRGNGRWTRRVRYRSGKSN